MSTETTTQTAPETAKPAQTTPPAQPAQDWTSVVPAKYKRDTMEATLAELSKGYAALESKLGAPKEKPAENPDALKIPEEKPVQAPAPIDDDASPAAILEQAGLKQEDVVNAWKEHGSLTPEQYAALRNRFGVNKAAVDQYLRGQQAEAELATREQASIRASAIEIVGGEAQLKSLLETARDFVPADEIDDINARLANPRSYKGALRDLLDYKQKKDGKKIVSGAMPAGAPQTSAFRTQVEMRAAMAEANKKLGDWTKDRELVARIDATKKQNPNAVSRPW